MWQQDMPDLNGDGQITPEDDNMPWCEALAYCENLSLAGHDDWRLPNVRELQSIVDYGRHDPAIDPVFEAVSDSYWSSTSGAFFPGFAWIVVFNVGFVGGLDDHEGSYLYVRAARS